MVVTDGGITTLVYVAASKSNALVRNVITMSDGDTSVSTITS